MITEKIEIPTTKNAIYTKIRDYMEEYKKELFKDLCKKRQIKGFIDSKVEHIYSQLEMHMKNGYNYDEAYELVMPEIYF